MGIATTTTWGITDIQFTAGYCALFALVAGWVWWLRRTTIAGRSEPVAQQLGLYELAMVNGGAELAITTAAVELQRTGALRGDELPCTLIVAGKLDARAAPLEREVFAAVERAPGITAGALRDAIAHGPAIAALRAELERAALLVDERDCARVRRWWIAGALLAAIGAARVIAGLSADAPVAFALVATTVVVIVTRWHAQRRLGATWSGLLSVTTAQGSRDELRARPEPHDAALATALFGVGALWLAAPAIATTLAPTAGRARLDWGGGGGGGACGACGGGGGGGCGGGGG